MALPSPLLILGCGYVGTRLAQRLLQSGVQVLATTRDSTRAEQLRDLGIVVVGQTPEEIDAGVLTACRAIVDSIPLQRSDTEWSDPQQNWVEALVARCPALVWAGYLSSTSVYCDAGGDWVDETTASLADSGRGLQRLHAEQAWLASGAPVELFRLSGIYGPGRNLVPRLRAGGYRTVAWHTPRFSNRIHVDDVVASLLAAMAHPKKGRVVNVSDDLPLPHAEYVEELAQWIGCTPPQQVDEAEASLQFSPAYLAFFQDNKRISNRRLHRELLPNLRYPSFRSARSTFMAEMA